MEAVFLVDDYAKHNQIIRLGRTIESLTRKAEWWNSWEVAGRPEDWHDVPAPASAKARAEKRSRQRAKAAAKQASVGAPSRRSTLSFVGRRRCDLFRADGRPQRALTFVSSFWASVARSFFSPNFTWGFCDSGWAGMRAEALCANIFAQVTMLQELLERHQGLCWQQVEQLSPT